MQTPIQIQPRQHDATMQPTPGVPTGGSWAQVPSRLRAPARTAVFRKRVILGRCADYRSIQNREATARTPTFGWRTLTPALSRRRERGNCYSVAGDLLAAAPASTGANDAARAL